MISAELQPQSDRKVNKLLTVVIINVRQKQKQSVRLHAQHNPMFCAELQVKNMSKTCMKMD